MLRGFLAGAILALGCNLHAQEYKSTVVNGDGKYGEIYYVVDIIKFVAQKDYLKVMDGDMTSPSIL